MSLTIDVLVNGTKISYVSGDNIFVKERDEIQFLVLTPNGIDQPKIYVEDHSLEFQDISTTDNGILYATQKGFVFREVFGLSVVRCYWNEIQVNVCFDVMIHKIQAHQIEEMIRYLYSHSDSLIRVCLARSTIGSGSLETGSSDPETTLSTVEQFVSLLLNSRLELQHQLKKRLVQTKTPIWEATSHQQHIDVSDVLENMDALVPASGEGDVFIQGRFFNISGLDVTTMKHTSDVFENAVVVGAIASMREGIENLFQMISLGRSLHGVTSHDKEHECLSEVLSRVTIGSMQMRCKTLMDQLDDLLRYFKYDLGVEMKGTIKPVITPFVRSSRVYRALFERINEWYSLGTPSTIGIHLLMKLRTVSKIYEFFVLFKLLEYFQDRQWTLEYARQQKDESYLIPEQVDFLLGDQKMTILYDMPVAPWSESTLHNDLVDLRHSYSNSDYWYRPDFVLRLQIHSRVKYFILDAKYSTLGTVENRSLPDLVTKYFVEMGVYDAVSRKIRADHILGVIAVFPGTTLVKGIWSYYKTKFNSNVPRLPYAAAATLSPQDNCLVTHVLDTLIETGVSEARIN